MLTPNPLHTVVEDLVQQSLEKCFNLTGLHLAQFMTHGPFHELAQLQVQHPGLDLSRHDDEVIRDRFRRLLSDCTKAMLERRDTILPKPGHNRLQAVRATYGLMCATSATLLAAVNPPFSSQAAEA